MIKTLAHICFTANDLQASLEFYKDKLGLTHAFDFINDQGELHGVYIKVGPTSFIEIFAGNVDGQAQGGSYRHFCLEVDDIETTVADLRAKGVEVTDPTLGKDNSWQAWLADPDGNRIELHAYTDESWQAPWLT